MIGAILMGLFASCLAPSLTDTPDSPESPSLGLPTEENLLIAESPSSGSPTEESLLATELPSSESSTEVNLITADGISYPTLDSESETRTLLLLHGAYKNSQAWDSFKEIAQDEGYAVFTLDFRGHGQSEGEQVIVEAMDNDVDAALEWLEKSLTLSEKHIILMGESLGASLALRAGARHPEVPAAILLSPGMKLWEISIQEAIVNYGPRPLLLVAAEEDEYPAATVRQLDEKAQGPHQLLLFPGAWHGTEILEANPGLSFQILNWLQEL